MVLLENLHCLFYVGDLEDAGCAATFCARGAVGVGYVDMVGGEFFGNGGEGTGPVVENDTKDIGFIKGQIGLDEDAFRFFGVVEDDSQDAVLDGVHHGHSGDVDFDFGEFAEDVSEDARFIDHKD
jgi:hypothetical protein